MDNPKLSGESKENYAKLMLALERSSSKVVEWIKKAGEDGESLQCIVGYINAHRQR